MLNNRSIPFLLINSYFNILFLLRFSKASNAVINIFWLFSFYKIQFKIVSMTPLSINLFKLFWLMLSGKQDKLAITSKAIYTKSAIWIWSLVKAQHYTMKFPFTKLVELSKWFFVKCFNDLSKKFFILINIQ